MLDHIGITVANFDRSMAFYDKVLGSIGYRRMMTLIPGEYPGPNKVAGYGRDQPQFWIGENGMSFWDERHAPAKSPIHLAFKADGPEQVKAFYEAALAAGGTDYGPPGPRPQYHPGYYGAFILDPDGNNIEAVCHNVRG